MKRWKVPPRINKKYVALALVSLFILMFGNRLMSTSYVTAYEGAKAVFYGVRDNENQKIYNNAQKWNASLCRFDTQMAFDRDDFYSYSCNIVGEMTSIQIPLGDTKWVPPEWVPQAWWRDSLSWKNPRNVYEWKVVHDDGSVTVYRMEEWVTKWFVTLSAEWDSGPDFFNPADEAENRRYRNLEVWIELDINPVWYFEGQSKVYFAIAKVELSNFKYDGEPRVAPMSVGSVLTVYTEPFGRNSVPGEEQLKAFYYQNTTLNPLYFRDRVYVYINLLDFGTREWWETSLEYVGLKAQGDAVTFGFTVTQFVVGEWKVKDVQSVKDYEGRTSKIAVAGIQLPNFLEWLGNISPLTWLGLGSFGLVAIAIITLIVMVSLFGPQVLLKWMKLFKRRKSE